MATSPVINDSPPPSDAPNLNTPQIKTILDRLTMALHKRNNGAITAVAIGSAFRPKAVRKAYADRGERPDEEAYVLGALEALNEIATRVAARKAGNARQAVMRLPRARKLLALLGRCPKGTALPSELTRQQGAQASNISPLLSAFKDRGLAKTVEGSTGDGRMAPIAITELGLKMLDELEPGWRQPNFEPEIRARKPRKKSA